MFVALLLSGAVVQQGIANWLARTDPLRANHIAPSNARIAVDAARIAIEGGRSPSAAEVRELVDKALSRDPTLATAIEFRALDAETGGDKAKAARLFQLSNEISRRSLATRLWLIQQRVDQGDVHGALNQFDIALRTSAAAPEVLFPVLAQAASDPTLAAPIARVLDRPTEWRAMFFRFAITEAGAASNLAGAILLMQDRAMLSRSGTDATLIGQLVAEHDFEMARRAHEAFYGRDTQPELVRDGNFRTSSARFPFGWGLVDQAKAGSMRSRVGGRSVLSYHALPGGDGQVAAQLLTLSEGSFTVSTRSAEAAEDPAAPPYWTITCGEEGGAQIALLDLPVNRGVSAEIPFTVPSRCKAQWLALNLRLSDAPQGQKGSIAFVEIEAD